MANTPTVTRGTPGIPTSSDGQHRDSSSAPNNGQKSLHRDSDLGRKTVPLTAADADVSTARKA